MESSCALLGGGRCEEVKGGGKRRSMQIYREAVQVVLDSSSHWGVKTGDGVMAEQPDVAACAREIQQERRCGRQLEQTGEVRGGRDRTGQERKTEIEIEAECALALSGTRYLKWRFSWDLIHLGQS